MKFTYLELNQKKAIEMELDSIIGVLIYFISFIGSGVILKREIEDDFVCCMQYEKYLGKVLILGIKSKDALKRRLKKLVNAELLIFKLLKNVGTYTFHGIEKKYEELIFHNKHMKEKNEEIHREAMQKSNLLKSREGSTHISTPVLLKSKEKSTHIKTPVRLKSRSKILIY
ncbi:hypothetical protein GNF80_06045 [Clostridium perfringens]|nr:hypothetical protein [Clostridium perfringens]